jgi:ABC-type glycerol-3-phosphate transport system substrate-binding protein
MTPGDAADIGILRGPELGDWAERGELARVPVSLRMPDHAFQWTGVLPIYREQLIEWGGQAQAVPLAGDGFVIVYRADRLADAKFVEAFRTASGRRPAAPATWEDFADLAIQLSKFDGKPSLPPMNGAAVADLFFRIVASYDRPGVRGSASQPEAVGSFQFDLASGEPRLNAPGFRAAADVFAQLAAGKCFAASPPPGQPSDPIAALDRKDAPASLAVVSLAELAKLPLDKGVVPARFAIAPIPGTRQYFDPEKGMVATTIANYVPYFSGGRIGVVRSRCQNPEAAFDLLAELGGPARSLEIVATPGLGAGPFRSSHLERDRLPILYGYGFEAERTRQLQDALQQFVRGEVKTPALGLRGPDQEALADAAAAELVKLTTGSKPDEVLKQLTAAWKQVDSKTPLDTRLRWRKMAAGTN